MKKKTPKLPSPPESDMRPEYDFTGGGRGKHYKALQVGYTVKIHRADGTTLVKRFESKGAVVLAPDVQPYFPNSKAVNRALRSLIAIIPEKRKAVARKAHSLANGRRLTAKNRTKTLR